MKWMLSLPGGGTVLKDSRHVTDWLDRHSRYIIKGLGPKGLGSITVQRYDMMIQMDRLHSVVAQRH